MPKYNEETKQWERTLDSADKDYTDIGTVNEMFTGTNVDYTLLDKDVKAELERLRGEYNRANDDWRVYWNGDRGSLQQNFIDNVNNIIKNPSSAYSNRTVIDTQQTDELLNNNSPQQPTTQWVIGGTENNPNTTTLSNDTLEQLVKAMETGIPIQSMTVTNPDGSTSTIDPSAITGAINKTQQQEQAKLLEQTALGVHVGMIGKNAELRNSLAELQQQGNYDLALNNQNNTAQITNTMLNSWLNNSEQANQRASTILNTRL